MSVGRRFWRQTPCTDSVHALRDGGIVAAVPLERISDRFQRLARAALVSLLLLSSATVWAQGLTVWSALEGETSTWLTSEVAAFERATGVEVEVLSVPLGEIRERAVATGEEPGTADLFVGVPHTQIGELAQAGVLLDVSDYATDDYLSDLIEPAREAFTLAGSLMGLPLWVEGPALIINSEHLPSAPASYEQLLEAAQALNGSNRFGFLFDYTNFYYAYTWIRSYGGYLFGRDARGDYLANDIGLASDGAIAGVQELRRLRFELGLLPAAANYTMSARLFREGSLAMHYDGPWAAATYLNAGMNIQVVPLPPRDQGQAWTGFMGSTGVLLNAATSERITAVNLAKWLVRTEAQARLALDAFRIPSSLAAAEESGDPHVQGFSRAIRTADPVPGVPEMGRVWQPMGEALRALATDPQLDPAVTLRKAVEEILPD